MNSGKDDETVAARASEERAPRRVAHAKRGSRIAARGPESGRGRLVPADR